MAVYDDDPSRKSHLEIRAEDRPFKRVRVSADLRQAIREIHGQHPEWGPERIIAHAKHVKRLKITYNQVRTVLDPSAATASTC